MQRSGGVESGLRLLGPEQLRLGDAPAPAALHLPALRSAPKSSGAEQTETQYPLQWLCLGVVGDELAQGGPGHLSRHEPSSSSESSRARAAAASFHN